ncbi:outer membrane beta-barrel protein [Haliscomenobacter hydrossis]|uniref:TonB-dependent receptor plug n=1 Tax=Haliscomenobacter hydrossis (strain ATCC 27775 / DSM 1100 / LMG 10767 / O) TaxID=760192 RepID=F4L5W0_HALH1|nr:outer membrane beta-barrel protein [Haliscomenobacter hydrossis]AEE52070.1 TonB-dependent receptor plug [Haliscomenobacter hydrossis DSM 1100]
MKLLVTTGSMLLLCLSLTAQANLNGKLQDENRAAIPYANILLLESNDSSLIKAAISNDDGSFEIKDIPTGKNYLLRVVMLGFTDHFQKVTDFKENLTLNTISLHADVKTLATAEVTARKPFLEQKAGTMIVNVANSITGASGSALDVLRKVPGMIVVNDRISLAGQQGLSILIDGRPTQYMDMQSLLKDMPSANIDRIEVISQPGARFDAQGTGAVLNIILKRNMKLGLNGTATLGAGKGRFWKYRGSGTLNFRNEKFNFTNLVAFSHRSWYQGLSLDRVVGTELYQQYNFQPGLPYSLNVKSGVDYYLDKNQTLGLSVNALGTTNQSTNENTTTILTDLQKAREELLTTNKTERRTGLINVDAYYEFKLDTSGQKINADVSVNRYGRDVSNLLQTTLRIGEGTYPNRRQEQPGNTEIEAYRIDYTKPFGKKLKIETGLKYSHAVVDNDLQANIFSDNTWVNDPTLSNHFIFTENISAAYVSSNFTLGKVEGQAGLRYENSVSTGYSVTVDSTQERRISRLFPSLSLSAPLTDKLGLALAYSNRINRPGYSSLNPFVRFLDPYTYEKGNPFLRPEITDSYKVSLTYDKQPFFNLEYSRTNNVIQLVTQQDESTGVGFGMDDNLATFERYGGSLFFPLEFVKKLSGYGGVMVFYNRYESEVFAEQFNKGRWNVTAFLQGTYTLPKDWKFEIGGWYNGPGIEGIQIAEHLYSVSLGVQKKILKERGNLNLSMDDILFRYWHGRIDHANFEANIRSEWETQIVNLTFTYNFGNQYLNKAARRRSGASEEQGRVNEK